MGTSSTEDVTAVAPVSVLTVDDQVVFLRAARDLIAATPGFEHVAQATSGREALELAAQLEPNLVLLDVRMPEMDGIETAQRLVAAGSRAVVVLVSLEDAPELPVPLMSARGVTHLRKQDLSTQALVEIWAARSPPDQAGG
jgi:DNA-binding NarL/FixJ family response regulator